MKTATLLDTGPLVAYLSHNDLHHSWTVERWKLVNAPLLTCEAVIVEAVFLLQRQRKRPEAVFELLHRDVIRLDFSLQQESATVEMLLRRYADVPISVADASLVRMSELIRDSCIFTLDQDFRLYRRHRRQHIPVLAPWE